jgi:hypothetical protein
MTATIQIHSIGPPPAMPADRVVAAMLRAMAQRKACLWDAVLEAIKQSSDGGPRAQNRMASRIRQAGAEHVILKAGKRGKYQLFIYTCSGWDARRDREIGVDNPIPRRPGIAYHLTAVNSLGRGRGAKCTSQPILVITHHALSRAAQRLGLRTEQHLQAVASRIWHGVIDFLEKAPDERWFDPPPHGYHAPFGDDGIVILEKHEKRRALVAVTVLNAADRERAQ